MKKNGFRIIIQVFVLAGVLLLTLPSLSPASAVYTYTPLEEFPGFANTGDFPQFIKNVYSFGIWTVGIAALLMITIGAFMYITSAGNSARMDKAKGIITDAILGLFLALSAYLILYVINPDLVKVSLDMSILKQ